MFWSNLLFNPQGRIVPFYPEETDGMYVLNAGLIKCKQSQTKLFTMKKEILDSFEIILNHSIACCVTLSEYRSTQKHLFRKVESFSTIISYFRLVAQ